MGRDRFGIDAHRGHGHHPRECEEEEKMRFFDVAAGPMVFGSIGIFIGIPLGVGLLVLAIVLIVKNHRKQ